jgi:hypothetical protein
LEPQVLPQENINLITFVVSPKFPESTVAGLYKRAVAENHYQDAVRFGAQKINWTLREFDVKSI